MLAHSARLQAPRCVKTSFILPSSYTSPACDAPRSKPPSTEATLGYSRNTNCTGDPSPDSTVTVNPLRIISIDSSAKSS
jgi:hypothetical protein